MFDIFVSLLIRAKISQLELLAYFYLTFDLENLSKSIYKIVFNSKNLNFL